MCSLQKINMRIYILIISLFLSIAAFTQTAAQAEALFNNKDYAEAAIAYETLLQRRPTDALYNYRYARCVYELGYYDDAIDHFILSGERYPLRDYYLADSYFNIYRFGHAIEFFNNYANSKSPNIYLLHDAKDKIRRAEIASKLINRVEDIAIIDTFIVDKQKFLEYYELSRETGHFTMETKKLNEKDINLISFITQRGDRKIFADIVNNQTKLFTTNKLLDGWSQPELLSKQINNYDNINYPFLMLDGITLYFAADNEQSIGGYDIFMTRYNSGTNDYLIPDNIGMPFNSFYNDYMMVIDETLGAGWFVSDRFQTDDKVCIYQFKYSENKKYLTTNYSLFITEYAQLKQFKKVSQHNNQRVETQIEAVEKINSNAILIQINDSIAYTDVKQFKSQTSLKIWQECTKLREKLREKEVLMNSFRTLYADIEGVEEKKTLAKDITTLETEIINLRLQINNNAKDIRNEEIKSLETHNFH